MKNLERLLPKVEEIIRKDQKKEDILLEICQLLQNEVDYYNWVGFYFRNGNKEELVLGTYVGAPTDHTVIPFGKGICGQFWKKPFRFG